MKITIDYTFGQPIYIKNDDEQIEYRLNRIIVEQKNLLTLELLDPDGSKLEVAEIHCSKEKDVIKSIGGSTKKPKERKDGEED